MFDQYTTKATIFLPLKTNAMGLKVLVDKENRAVIWFMVKSFGATILITSLIIVLIRSVTFLTMLFLIISKHYISFIT